MIATNFAQKGWQVIPGQRAPERYQVFGERCSGTNFVKRLIGRNSPMRPMENLGWKHGFPHMTAIPANVAVVAVVRDARRWALSLHSKPWHCPDRMQAMDFSSFIRAEWATIADRKRYFPQVQDIGGQGQPLQHDRHPLTGATFENIFALRRAKLAGLTSFLNRGCTCVLVRMEAVQADPQEFLQNLHTSLQISVPERKYQPVVKNLGSKFLPSVPDRPATPDGWNEADLAFLKTQIDPEQEALLGYSYP